MPTVPGFAACSYELRHALVSRSAYLTFGIDCTGTDPAAVATQLRSAFTATNSLYTKLDANVTLLASRVSMGTDGTEDIVGINSNPVTCMSSMVGPPPNVAVLVHKRTARGGRRGRGRMYIPWALATTDITEAGIITGTTVSGWQTAVDAWAASLAAGAGPLVILHRSSLPGTTKPTVAGPPNPVTSLTVDTLVATQRRRLGRA